MRTRLALLIISIREVTSSPSNLLMQVHLLDYNEETGVLDKTVFMHSAGEIWSVIFVVNNFLLYHCPYLQSLPQEPEHQSGRQRPAMHLLQ